MSGTPSVGRIVHYRLAADDFEKVKARRAVRTGSDYCDAYTGDVYAALVLRRWVDGAVNLRVFLDGDDDLWVTQRRERNEQDPGNAEGHGCWCWPPRQDMTQEGR